MPGADQAGLAMPHPLATRLAQYTLLQIPVLLPGRLTPDQARADLRSDRSRPNWRILSERKFTVTRPPTWFNQGNKNLTVLIKRLSVNSCAHV
jgi:hypothetical protein